MFITNFKTAGRHLLKNKAFALINLAGLSIGIAVGLLILQYVGFELSFDRFNRNAGDLYRVVNDRYQNGVHIQHGMITYSAIGKALQDDFPEVVNHTRVLPDTKEVLRVDTTIIGDQDGFGVDNSFLSMFTYPLVAGNPRNALAEPRALILSLTLAKKLFHEDSIDPASILGKSLFLGNDQQPYKITGICQDIPANSHLKFGFLISYLTYFTGPSSWKDADYSFTDSDFWHYIQLRHGIDYRTLEAKFEGFSQRHFQGTKVSGSIEKFYLQPLLKAHLYSDFEYEIGVTGSAWIVWGLLLIAVLIILIAWVNYVNLSTANASERAKEVGVRKVNGATRFQLVRQFLTESLVVNGISLILAIGWVVLTQNAFNSLVNRQLSLPGLLEHGLGTFPFIFVILIPVIVGIILTGFYPAYVLSSWRPDQILKGKYSVSSTGIMLRKALVIAQYSITVMLILGSWVVYRQIRLVSSQDLGFNLSQILVVKGPSLTPWDSTFISKQVTFMDEVDRLPGVKGTASSWRLPGDELGRNFDVRRASAPEEEHFTVRNNGVSTDFIGLYRIKMLAGRHFNPGDYHADWTRIRTVIINANLVKLLGFPSAEEAVGEEMIINKTRYEIVGVITDFHQKSLHYAVEPTLFYPAASNWSPISVKVNTGNLRETLAAIRQKYDQVFPGNIFDYYFLDQQFNRQYQNDRLFGKAFTLFAILAVFIASLGLLGLSLTAILRRTREIGIRKVLGASVTHIMILLTSDFVRLVIIAIVIASPAAWYIMNRWLMDFTVRVRLSWWMFLSTGLLAIVIAVITVSLHAMRAALVNPVNSLRTE